MKSQSFSRAELEASAALAAIRKATARQLDKVPPGWRTSEEYARLWNKPEKTAAHILMTGAKAGAMERKKFVVMCGEIRRAVWHYRQKKKS